VVLHMRRSLGWPVPSIHPPRPEAPVISFSSPKRRRTSASSPTRSSSDRQRLEAVSKRLAAHAVGVVEEENPARARIDGGEKRCRTCLNSKWFVIVVDIG